MSEEVKIGMKKVAIVSCDKWQGKIKEDINLKVALNNLGIEADIVSWQKPLKEGYDLLVLRSAWGYQNDYYRFREWLLEIKNKKISLLNEVDLILTNILKDKQFKILKENGVECIKTYFLNKSELNDENVLFILNNLLEQGPCVIKPTISGSGENTFLINYFDDVNVPNIIDSLDIVETFAPILNKNSDCGLMFQPYISEINNGEYSCIFVEGELTHTMLRFPAVFHSKKKPYLIDEVPTSILELARKVEKIPEFSNYLYMRVDMVIVGNSAKVIEVELAEPDFLTKYIENSEKRSQIIKKLARKIERRID